MALIATMAALTESLRKRLHRNYTLQHVEAPHTEVLPALGAEVSMSDDSPQCTCSFGRYSFQQWPLTVENYGCVGGCGGGEFEINNYDGVVKSILLWFRGGNSGNHIRAIRVVYEDGTVMERGGHDGSPASFTFQPGEWIVGDLRLSPSGYGSGRWGSIGFTTNTGRTWNVGSRGTEYYFPTGGTTSRAAYITGFSGASGSDIDRMGVIFWKPIIDTSYTSITYPTLSSAPKLTAPTEVRSRVFCNDGPFELPATERVLTSVVTVGSERCFTASFSTTFAFSLTVSGGIPFIKEGEATAEWSTTFSAGTENCRSQTDTRTETLTFPSFQIPPYSRIRQTFSQWAGTLASLPYSATMRITMLDGTTFDRWVEGYYRGVAYNDVHLAYQTDTDVTQC